MRGGDKLLEPVGGQPLLRLVALRALATGCPVIVTLPSQAPLRCQAVADLDLIPVEVPDADTGMSASFRALANVDTDLLVCLGDMPEIETAHMIALLAARTGSRPVRATTEDGQPGQPVLFPRAMVPQFAALTGDEGARSLLSDCNPELAPLPGNAAVTDLDTPEAWAAWRARTLR